MYIDLPTKAPPEDWIMSGVAAFLALRYWWNLNKQIHIINRYQEISYLFMSYCFIFFFLSSISGSLLSLAGRYLFLSGDFPSSPSSISRSSAFTFSSFFSYLIYSLILYPWDSANSESITSSISLWTFEGFFFPPEKRSDSVTSWTSVKFRLVVLCLLDTEFCGIKFATAFLLSLGLFKSWYIFIPISI